MDVNLKIKPNWFMRLIGFQKKEATFEILPELTPDEKSLEMEMKRIKGGPARSLITGKTNELTSARSIRAEAEAEIDRKDMIA